MLKLPRSTPSGKNSHYQDETTKLQAQERRASTIFSPSSTPSTLKPGKRLGSEKKPIVFFSVSPLDKQGGDFAYIERLSACMGDDAYHLIDQGKTGKDPKTNVIGIDSKNPHEALVAVMGKEEFRDKNKILVIGSRYDAKNAVFSESGKHSLVFGSGAWFRRNTVLALKSMGVQIVVCCLEFKFYRCSLERSRMLTNMFRDHLFLADKIVFLNEGDLSDFQSVVDQILKQGYLPLDEMLLSKMGERTKEKMISQAVQQNTLKNEIAEHAGVHESKEDWIDALKKRAVFIPGIYTVGPLASKDVIVSEKRELDEKEFTDYLVKRPPSVMCFGLIRKDKGFKEAVALARHFEKAQFKGKVYLIGGVKSFSVFFDVVQEIFGEGVDYTKTIHQMVSSILRSPSNSEKIKGAGIRKLKEEGLIDANNNPTHKFNFSHVSQVIRDRMLDRFCEEFYKRLCSMQKDNSILQHIEVMIGPKDSRVREVALMCRYAMKFDNKGMADNASSILSTIAMCLPTFTTQGLLTPPEYLAKTGYYSETAIMPASVEYVVNANEELEPKIPEDLTQWLFGVISSEMQNESRYRRRLYAIEVVKQKDKNSPESAAKEFSRQLGIAHDPRSVAETKEEVWEVVTSKKKNGK